MNYYSGRGNFLSNIPTVTRFLLVINVAMFILMYLSKAVTDPYNTIFGDILSDNLSLFSIHSGRFKSYQLISHMFMHGSFMHLLFNMYFGVYMFGRILEYKLGSKKFFILYFISGLGAAGIQLLVYYMNAIPTGMVGASGAVYGLLAAFAVMFPDMELMMIFIPIPIKAKYFVPIIAVLELLLNFGNFSGDNIAHMAHIGGAIFGFVIAFYWKKTQFKQGY